MQTVDISFFLHDPQAVENLRTTALAGLSWVLADKLHEFMDANPGVKPDSFQLEEMLRAAFDDAVLVGRREYAEASGAARAALLLLISASNVSNEIFDVARATPMEGFLSTEDVAKNLNVSRPYVVKLADSGKLGAVEITEGGQRRIPFAAVETYRRELQAKGRTALKNLTTTSQDAGLYSATASPTDGKGEPA